MKQKQIKKIIYLTLGIIFLVLTIAFIVCLPDPLFDDPYSTVVVDMNGDIVGVRISDDGQWRFPETEKISNKFRVCIITYEDKRFYAHKGIDPFAIMRAVKLNLSSSKVISGGSTLTMQTIRLSRKGKPRNLSEKIKESILAIRLESGYSKEEILNLYASHAPFGGNIVGIEAAAWRYFGRTPHELSWAENAMLAVLPNSPSMIHTAKNRHLLKNKRDMLLEKIYKAGFIDKTEYELALEEDIPQHPRPYPMHAYHLVSRASKEFEGTDNKIKTTINLKFQKQANEIINRHNKQFIHNDINNISCLILEVSTGNAMVYIGNGDFSSDIPEKAVDMVTANRSTGSILKPFLYSAMLSSGEILPKTLQKDIPTRMGGFSPENFDRQFDGAVYADEALARSLNIPFVHMLKQYGILRFLYVLKYLDLNTINKSSDYYGLPLILGGGESNLWDICSAYASMARSLNNYVENDSRYSASDYHKATYIYNDNSSVIKQFKNTSLLSAASLWFTFEAMTSVNRPGQEKQWRSFSSRQKVAWKTGTSFGFKDAWSVAVTPEYVVGIWVGNATGEGKPGITGLRSAAPVLFEIINILPDYDKWFDKPYDEMIKVNICTKSGHLAGMNCDITDSLWIPSTGINTNPCPYHKVINLDASGSEIVNAECYPINDIIRAPWFVLPPSMEYYYRMKNSAYQPLPPYRKGCEDQSKSNHREIMELMYPDELSRVYIPVDLQGDTLGAVFKIAHRDKESLVYWHINDKYIGLTKDYHEMSIKLPAGNYKLNLIDEKGNSMVRNFSVVSRLSHKTGNTK